MPLLGRYRLYKTGTKRLIDWLANSASHCCDIKTIIKSLADGQDPRAAKKAGKQVDLKLEIRTQELLRLAQAIVASQTPVDVPRDIIEIAEDVIAGREECAEWYAAQALEGGGDLEQENASHQYFITVLQRVLKLLNQTRAKRPTTEPNKVSSQKKKKQPTPISQPEQLRSLFDLLEVEEPSDSPLGNTRRADILAANKADKTLHFKLVEEEEDLSFATWCFLQDLHDIRCFVRETWLEYSKGDISFLAASSITDTAFGLLRVTAEQFAQMQTTDWLSLLEYFGLEFFCRGLAVWMCPQTPGFKPRIPNTSINITELLCPIAGLCLTSYKTEAQNLCHASKGRAGRPNEGDYPSVQPAGGYDHVFSDVLRSIALSGGEAGRLDECYGGVLPSSNGHVFRDVLLNIAPKLTEIAHTAQCQHIVLDEFVRGLVQIHHSQDIPVWMVVACQIYLDMYDLLGNYIKHGVDALQDTFTVNRATAAEVAEYQAACATDMSDVRSAINLLHEISHASNRFEHLDYRSIKDADGGDIVVSPLERSLPAHAGAIFIDLKLGMHNFGCQIANHRHMVLSTAHLYKALRSRGLLKTDWHDMDFVISTFGGGGRQPLVAKSGQKMETEAMARHYALALGVPATDFAKGGRREKGKMPPLKEARKLGVVSPLLQGMISRASSCGAKGHGCNAKTTVEAVLGLLSGKDEQSSSGRQTTSRAQPMHHGLTPTDLLAKFRKLLLADEPQLNFDYTSFTLKCARLLDEITETAAASFRLDGFEDTRHVGAVLCLMQAPASNPAVTAATQLLQDIISTDGKHFIKQAYNQSSGRIPKHLRPTIERRIAEREDSMHLERALLDYAGTKYSLSGSTIAAYHPGIINECCNGDGHHVGETDPAHESHAHRHQKLPLVAWGSAIPSAILDQALEAAQASPEVFMRAMRRSLDQRTAILDRVTALEDQLIASGDKRFASESRRASLEVERTEDEQLIRSLRRDCCF